MLFIIAQEFEIADSKTVHPQMIIFTDPLQRSDVLQVWMFGIFKVMQDRSGCNNPVNQFINSKSFQAMCAEVLKQALICIGIREYPFIQCIREKTVAKIFAEYFL